MPDLSYREWALLGPIAAVVLWMGVYPESFLRPMRADIGRLIERVERSAPKGDSNLKVSAAGHAHGTEDHGAH
jgi:NADH-quinone oxidoreductase subunit M